MKKKIILSAGGTGGHLFPAQSLAKSLSHHDIRFMAGGLSSNCYFDRKDFFFHEIESATFSFSKPKKLMSGCPKILKGTKQAQRILKEFNPHLVIGFGSFLTLPVLFAALLQKIPIILHEQNAIPGRVNRFFSRFAWSTTITFPKTRDYLRGKARREAMEVLFPLRSEPSSSRQEAFSYFGIPENTTDPIIIVFGGSQGAALLNTLFLEMLPQLMQSELLSIHILHFTGNDERTEAAKMRYANLGFKAHVKSFEPRMDLAMQIAHCAVTRAGAATICELIEYELPALVIPYPFATENHQEKNGEYFVSEIKGGRMHREAELTAAQLATSLLELSHEAQKLKQNIYTYKKKRYAKPLSEWVEELLL